MTVFKRWIIILASAVLLTALSACLPDAPSSTSEDSPDLSSGESSSQTESLQLSEEPSEDSFEVSFEESSEVSEPEESGWKAFRSDREIRVETYEASPIPETGFSVLTSALTVGVGKNSPISYAFKPIGATDHSLTWVSSNPSIATVSETGVVTGVGVGATYVTATTKSGRSSSCKVTVVQMDTTILGNLIDRLTEGTFSDWTFAYCDMDFDGEKDLIARKADPRGIAPTSSVYRVSDGKLLATFDTGEGEEWGYWTGEAAPRYYLISFKQTPEPSVTRYAIDLLLAENGELKAKRLYYRDEYPGGDIKYYVSGENGELSETDETKYTEFRTNFFASNKQSGNDLTFVTARDSEAVARALRKTETPV